MDFHAWVTIITICGAVILFATEWLSLDLVALLVMSVLVIFGVITPEQSIAGFSNKATITVAFMFVLSAALMKTGAMQVLANKLSKSFSKNFSFGMISLMLVVAAISAFINNTPVVAVFIPISMQIAKNTGISPSKMLIPVSFASIFGGTCTLIGTSTNIVVSGIAEKSGVGGFSMFSITPLGLVFLALGILYMIFLGIRLLPNRGKSQDLKDKFGLSNYITEIKILSNSSTIGSTIMESELVKELEMDVIEVQRDNNTFSVPQGDFVLMEGDVLRVKCSVNKLKILSEKNRNDQNRTFQIGSSDTGLKNSTLTELIVTSNSEFVGQTLRELDFRRRFRAIPLAIQHREEVQKDGLYDVILKPGDVILAEVKSHFMAELKKLEAEQDSPFFLLSNEEIVDFNVKKFALVAGIILAIITLSAFEILDIMVGTIAGVVLLAVSKVFSLKEAYEAISWEVVFLLAGALCMGTAMTNTGLDLVIAKELIDTLGPWGPIAIVSGMYLVTSLLTEIMSNNAIAALLAPIAIATAQSLGLSPMPFLMAITFAASASFMTPVGYQTNAMVYSAGQYKFKDFLRVGTPLNFFFWIVASILIPIFFPF